MTVQGEQHVIPAWMQKHIRKCNRLREPFTWSNGTSISIGSFYRVWRAATDNIHAQG